MVGQTQLMKQNKLFSWTKEEDVVLVESAVDSWNGLENPPITSLITVLIGNIPATLHIDRLPYVCYLILLLTYSGFRQATHIVPWYFFIT